MNFTTTPPFSDNAYRLASMFGNALHDQRASDPSGIDALMASALVLSTVLATRLAANGSDLDEDEVLTGVLVFVASLVDSAITTAGDA